MSAPFVYLSLGAGVQSSALLVLSILELQGCPRADAAIFADTQDEPSWVYEHLNVLEHWSERRGVPVYRVTAGSLSGQIEPFKRGLAKRWVAIPAWTETEGKAAPLWRQCTRDYKVRPIHRKVRDLLGAGSRGKIGRRVTCLLGISRDEAHRMRESEVKWITHQYPLVDAGLTRAGCVKVLQENHVPVPRKSACVFCPYHSEAYWTTLKLHHPQEWEKVCAPDETIRNMTKAGVERPVYLHKSLKPMREFAPGNRAQLAPEGFGNECEGLCGV